MFCNRLLAAGGVGLLLTACGAKGPPRPPQSREPQTVRDLFVRQSGSAIELRWSRPRARANGDPIQGPLTFRVLARNLERTPVPASAPPVAPAAAAANTGSESGPGPGAGTAATAAPAAPGPAAGVASPAPVPPASGSTTAQQNAAQARASEEAFLRDSQVVAEIEETPEQAAAAASAAKSGKSAKEGKGADTAKDGEDAKPPKPGKDKKSAHGDHAEPGTPGAAATTSGSAASPPLVQYSVLLGPERFPGTRLTSVRLAFAVVAQDANGRRSHARPILEIDPVAVLLPPADLRAEGRPEGIALSWKLPEPEAAPPGAAGASTPAPPPSRGVDIYRVELPAMSAASAGEASAAAAGAAARFPYKPMTGSPFTGGSAVDRSAVIGTSYVYEARSVTLEPGKGLRESVSSGTVPVTFRDVFAPGAPTLVTALPSGAGEAPSVRVAWSSPIDPDVAGYRIYRAEGDGAFTLAGAVMSPQVEWTDTSVSRGARYRYTVAAIDAATPPNESARSEIAEATLPEGGM